MLSLTLLSILCGDAAIQVPGKADGLETGSPAVFEAKWSQHKATVLFFLTTDCPIANRYAPEMARLEAEYRKKRIKMIRVYVSSSLGQVQQHGPEFGLTFEFVMDRKLAWARVMQITCTPEAAVVDPKGTLRYRGRIDARNVEHGKERPSYRRDLKIALDEILASKPVSVPLTPVTGCIINYSQS